jgi:hypothetical protein
MRQRSTSSHEAAETAARQRAIQAKTDARDARKKDNGHREEVPQTGARPYPVPPFPKQHQAKPGTEAALEPRPMYDAPHYLGSRKLEDKIALITGGDSALAGRSRSSMRAKAPMWRSSISASMAMPRRPRRRWRKKAGAAS